MLYGSEAKPKRDFYLSGDRVPRDKTVLVTRRKKINPLVYTCVSSVSAGGLVLAFVFLIYNLYHRKLRYVTIATTFTLYNRVTFDTVTAVQKGASTGDGDEKRI